jgi:O-antigen/teichoic acid export membrane protein
MNLSNIIKKLSGPVIFNVLGSIFGIISTIMISRFYGSEKLGTVSLSLKIIQILMVVSLFGFRQQIIKNVAIYFKENNSKAASHLVNNVKFFSALSSIITTLIVIIVINLFADQFSKDKNFVPFMSIFIFSLIFIVQTKNNTFILISLGKYNKSVLFDGFYNTIILVVLLLIAILFKIEVSIEVLAIIYFLSRFINYIFSFFIFYKNPFFTKGRQIDFKLLKNGKDFFLISVVNTIILNIDIIIVSIILSPTSVAIYAVCTRLAQILDLVTYVLSTVISPEIATHFHEKKFKELKHLISKYMLLCFLLASAFCTLSLLFSSFLLNLWGDEFADHSIELTLLITATSIGFVFSPYNNFLSMTGHQKLELKITTILSVFYIVTLVLLTYKYGLIGSSIAFLLRIFFMNFSKFFFSNRILNNSL